ncbi:uncharacterized protein BDR25DRAFT_306041 [Lindgomyces ingoldianus]|uniref:Uncharacterized protein n=1 Tax=Lindgomyces ingoldianus TaxID=673940 RepID=A0ACB6QIZ7_9PLEO|nr:uncharacterized protein BDR25DRAFT_306041 [Lindgomyces ingoldianus]KAF2466847.1 hypothetical protein BDR25DRAFT_306041 [Lindgomyces ingoldianus]
MSAAALQRRNQLRGIASETRSLLPTILSQLDSWNTTASSLHHKRTLTQLDPKDCPGYRLPEDDPEAGTRGTRIRVYDQDTFDAALDLQPGFTFSSLSPPMNKSAPTSVTQSEDSTLDPAAIATQTTEPSTSKNPMIPKPVAILNLASERHPGGGWLNGALAQEEALCFRSSLSVTLHEHYYPIPALGAIYSPLVLLIREAMSRGHGLIWPDTPAQNLPVTAVITMAALRRPELTRDGTYRYAQDKDMMKNKIRVILRVAVHQGHSKLVLGALGCGAFGNPPREVAQCFLEVFQEHEFQGGWWEDVVFAILDNARKEQGGKDGVGNFGFFYRALDGTLV